MWGWLGLSFGVFGISLIGFARFAGFYSLFAGDFTAVHINWLGLFDNGEWLMLLASLSMAIGTVMIAYVSRHVDSCGGDWLAYDYRRITVIWSVVATRIPAVAKYVR